MAIFKKLETMSNFYFSINPERDDICDDTLPAWAECFLPAVRAALKAKGLLMDEHDFYICDKPIEYVAGADGDLICEAEDAKVTLAVSVDNQHVCNLHVYQHERKSQPTKE